MRLVSPRIWSISAGFAQLATSPIFAASYHATAIVYRITSAGPLLAGDALAELVPGALTGLVAAGRGRFAAPLGGLPLGGAVVSAGAAGPAPVPPRADGGTPGAQPLPPPALGPVSGGNPPVGLPPVVPVDLDTAVTEIVSNPPPAAPIAPAVPAPAAVPLPAGGLLLLGGLGLLALGVRRRRPAA